MLKKFLSALLMLLIFIPISMVGGIVFYLFIYFISLIGMHEFLNIKESKKHIPIFTRVLSYIAFSFIIFNSVNSSSLIFSIDYRILSGIFALFLIPTILYHDSSIYSVNDSFFMIASILFLGISFSMLIVTRNVSFELLIYLLLIGVISDTYAFITGSLIGKRKLLESISPSKTVEGMIGGVVFGTFIPVMYFITVVNPNFNLLSLIFITLFLCVLGHMGDLCFSNIKRYFDKKDFSNMIPGHGGILDRFDSIIFILLGFMFFINIIGG